MHIVGPTLSASSTVERVLRALPRWFGIEAALLEYVEDAKRFPTFVVVEDGIEVGFLTIRQHFAVAWEIHCLGLEPSFRGRGIGRLLHAHVELWLQGEGARFVQVKTVADSHSSPGYFETRAFYAAMGYTPLEVFPELWGPRLPVLQLVKKLENSV